MIIVSVICPCYNEESSIVACVESMLQQDFALDSMELLFVDGNSTDNTRNLLESFAAQYPQIRILNNPHRTAPFAMNIGIREAKGEFIVRIDAHSYFPVNYISSLIQAMRTLPNAANVGGVCRTIPAGPTARCIAISEAMSHPFGVGNSMFRIGVKKVKKVDTVPFGCFYKSQLEQIGMYDEELTRNQDDELNARIIQQGGYIYLIPTIQIDYIARNSLRKMASMFYQYGMFKPLVNKKLSYPATLRQFMPPLLIAGTIIGIILSVAFPILWIAFFTIYGLYAAVGVVIGIKLAIKHKILSLILLMPFCFLLIHWSYGLGYWNGLFRIAANKSFNVRINR